MSQTPGQVGIQAAAVISGSFLSDQQRSPQAERITGAMMSISLITIPVLLDTSTQSRPLLDQFVTLYDYGHKIMPTLSVGTCALYLFIASRKRALDLPWPIYGLAAASTISIVPFTWIFMTPTNNALFAMHAASEPDFQEARELSVRWQWLHVIRSLFPLVGAVIGWRGLRASLG
ncbi:hypothetical protein N7466_001852 [Penicillium verhagenii]|uniref:uncharacterized protein n=1 Tax=Penicillium verhagenii TaxID=1562060 RepID=UPI002544F61F|nr:uncharacterized protein N7466_001852 [Penicillium verhagenii]KAJ5938718.1 hypothetical protein N7466_001852 [Penicillium verhagenii]